MEEGNNFDMTQSARLKVDDFLYAVEIVRSTVNVETLLLGTDYGSRVFIRIKLTKSRKCILKTIIKVSNNKELDHLGTILDLYKEICLSYY